MTIFKINKLADKLYRATLKKYRENNNYKAFSIVIEDELQKYNEEVANVIEEGINKTITKEDAQKIKENIYKQIKQSTTIKQKPIRVGVITKPLLSKILYNNLEDTKAAVFRELKELRKEQKGISETSKALYDGYTKNKDILNVKHKLAKYIKEAYTIKDRRAILSQIRKLKSGNLKSGYLGLIKAIEAGNDNNTAKALEVALKEKARYYATRIAKTEIQRAYNLQNSIEILKDTKVEFVKYVLNAHHPRVDICDYYNGLDLGYGRGIVPKDEMVNLPLHPHCLCSYRPYYIKPKFVKIKTNDQLAKFSKWEKQQILGSKKNYEDYIKGVSPITIFNRSRDKYPIIKVKNIIGGHIQKPVEKL